MTPSYITITKLTKTTTGGHCFIAYHPELPNVTSQGDTPEEARNNLAEATELAVRHLTDNNLDVPEAMTITPLFAATG